MKRALPRPRILSLLLSSALLSAQTLPVPQQPGGAVAGSGGSFSGNVVVGGGISAPLFDGGNADFDSLRVTGGPNSIDGGTTFGGDIAGAGAADFAATITTST